MKAGHTWSVCAYDQWEHLYLEMTGWSGKECYSVLGKLRESRLTSTNLQVSITPSHHHVIFPLLIFFVLLHIAFSICLGFIGPEHLNDISSSSTSSWEPHSEECGYLFFSWPHVYSKTSCLRPQKYRKYRKETCTLKIHNESTHIRYQYV